MQQHDLVSLRSSLRAILRSSSHNIADHLARVSWRELAGRERLQQLRGRSVMVHTTAQLAAAAAIIELDGLASRIVLCPPDLSQEHLAVVARLAEATATVSDSSDASRCSLLIKEIGGTEACSRGEATARRSAEEQTKRRATETEWILLTSGTTGRPKLVVHTLTTLAGAHLSRSSARDKVWSTFYDIRRYGGLQIFLRAACAGAPLVLSSTQESLAEFLGRAGAEGVTHISGTPSHWRGVLMNRSADAISPAYIRLSGEIADQALLNQLQSRYPQAEIVHAFASTEAGLAFEVTDARMGIPGEAIEPGCSREEDVQTKVQDGTLRIRSKRSGLRYLGEGSLPLKDAQGFVDTGDVVEHCDGRYYFRGRRDGTINVGGLKVHPEEVEAVLNSHPEVSVSLVGNKKNPITGALVIADVVRKTPALSTASDQALGREILLFCHKALPSYKVPAAISFVASLPTGSAGKLNRAHA